MTAGDWVVERFGKPEYTGENRCLPCTVVNAAIALLASAAVASLAATAWTRAAGVASAVGSLAVSAAVIGLRGYLVPGTPTLTTRYLPDRALAAFEKQRGAATAPPSADEADESPEGGVSDGCSTGSLDPEAVLRDAGAIRECEEIDDLGLSEEFREAWDRETAAIREAGVEKRLLASALGVDEAALTFDEYGNAFNARVEGSRVSQWESRAALIADLAAEEVFAARYEGWHELGTEARGEVLYALRSFVETCPECDGPVTVGRDAVESCCRSIEVVVVGCEDCDARLLEIEAAG